MERRAFSKKPDGGIELDLCFACHAIWFDQYESAQLTPGAVLDLFAQIHTHHGQPPRPLGEALRCPSCKERLRLTYGEGATLDIGARVEGGTRARLSLPAAVAA